MNSNPLAPLISHTITKGRPGRWYHYEVYPQEPGLWRIDFDGQTYEHTRDPSKCCLGRLHKRHGLCKNDPEEGMERCEFHGGASLSGPDSPAWRTGIRSGATANLKGKIGEVVAEMEGAEGLDDAATLTRALLAYYVRRLDADEEGKLDPINGDHVKNIMALVKELRACVGDIEAMRRERWLSPEEIRLFQAHILGVLQAFVPAERWSECMKALGSFVPGQSGQTRR